MLYFFFINRNDYALDAIHLSTLFWLLVFIDLVNYFLRGVYMSNKIPETVLSVAVMVNDMSEINIDAELVEHQGALSRVEHTLLDKPY